MKTTFINNSVRLGLAVLTTAGLSVVAPVSVNAGVIDGPKSETKVSSLISIREVGDLRFRVALSQPVSERVGVTVVDRATNNVLYSGTLNKTEVKGRVLDLSQLADGAYLIEVAAGKERVTQAFDIKTQINRVVLAHN